ncbi:MAG: hypothetical protein HC858_01535 [Brachymonas sp.]|nr:hypothetical protein [Brachymonas sp.]
MFRLNLSASNRTVGISVPYTLVFLTALNALNATAQPVANASPAAQCILAGRLDADQRWAPQVRGVELLDAAGKRVSGSSKESLTLVKAVRLSQPALLSGCNGNQPLASGEGSTAKKSPAPAVSAKTEPIPVIAVAYPPIRVGGSLVELELQVPSSRLMELTR